MNFRDILYKEGWHWEKSLLTYRVDSTISVWADQIAEALRRWSLVCGLEISAAHSPDGADIVFSSLEALDAPRAARGWSYFWGDDQSHVITRGFVGLPVNPPPDAAWVALHEIGHVLGLSHPYQEATGWSGDQSQTVMSYTPAAGGPANQPAPLDVAALQALYGPDRVLRSASAGDGSPGFDSLVGDAGPDSLTGGAGHDTLLGAQGADLLVGGSGSDVLHGGRDDDRLYGNADADVLFGDLGNDTLFGGQGDDQLWGGDGDDWLSGDAGNDTLTGGAGADRFVLRPGSGFSRVMDFDPAAGDRIALPAGVPYNIVRTVRGEAVIVLGVSMLQFDHMSADTVQPDWFVFL